MPILTMISSFQETQEGADVQVEAPEVPRPEELTSALEIFRTIDHPVAKFLGRTAAFDLRHVEGNIYLRLPGGSGQASSTCGPAHADVCLPRPRRRCTGRC